MASSLHDPMEEVLEGRAASGGPSPLPDLSRFPAGNLRLGHLPRSMKLFMSLMLLVAGLAYFAFLASIWQDTEMKIPLIVEAYGSMESLELIQHSFQYLFWFFGIFAVTGTCFLLTRYREKIKRRLALAVPLLILADIGSAWLIRYHTGFAAGMYLCGVLLALSFLLMFGMIQYDLWLRRD
jgi:glucan phosphoethanolaminetransferase (alkaline phosphatase superfamily)